MRPKIWNDSLPPNGNTTLSVLTIHSASFGKLPSPMPFVLSIEIDLAETTISSPTQFSLAIKYDKKAYELHDNGRSDRGPFT